MGVWRHEFRCLFQHSYTLFLLSLSEIRRLVYFLEIGGSPLLCMFLHLVAPCLLRTNDLMLEPFLRNCSSVLRNNMSKLCCDNQNNKTSITTMISIIWPSPNCVYFYMVAFPPVGLGRFLFSSSLVWNSIGIHTWLTPLLNRLLSRADYFQCWSVLFYFIWPSVLRYTNFQSLFSLLGFKYHL